jgi:dTDP-4-dehydrorhamnose reductase
MLNNMKILILGGNGMIGHKMYQIISDKYPDTWVLFKKKYIDIENRDLFKKNKIIESFDLSNFDNLINLLDNLNPDFILNAAGITIRRELNISLSKTILINSVLPNILDEWVTTKNKRLIQFSTDCVFSGKKGFYNEKSILDGQDLYSRTKALGEINSTNTLTLRGSMIGRELENKTELLEWFLNQKNQKIKGYNKVIYSGVTTISMAKLVLRIIDEYPKMAGLYNVSSSEISKYNLLQLLNTHFNTNVDIISDDSYSSNKTLDSSLFYEKTGFKKPDWHELVLELKKDCEVNNIYYK